MSSILALRQREAAHLATDAANYLQPSGILTSVNAAKCIALPTLHAAVSSTGPAGLGAFIGHALTLRCDSFDDVIRRGEELLPAIVEEYREYRDDLCATLYVIGWSQDQRRPGAFSMDVWSDGSARAAQVLENSANKRPERFKFTEQVLAGTPIPGPDLLAAAGFRVPDDLDVMDPANDLLHLLEIQRHEQIEDRFWVGGKAVLTTVDGDGIGQRVIHHWREDQVGELISPLPIDWSRWRRRETAVVDARSPLNRKQRRAQRHQGRVA